MAGASKKVGDMKSKFETSLGRIRYRVRYDDAESCLRITVVECKELKKMDRFGKSDPYVRVYLLPGHADIKKTDVKKKTLNPEFNQIFEFPVTKRDAMNKTIVFQVFDSDKLSKDDPIGEVQIPLWQLNLNVETDAWKDLHKVSGTKDKPAIINAGSRSNSPMKTSSSPHQNQGYGQRMSRPPYDQGQSRPPTYDQGQSRPPAHGQGQSRPSMSSGVPELKYEIVYEPGPNGQSGHLKLAIVECRNLKGSDMRGGKPDAYVQVYLRPGKHQELKTKVVQNDKNPVFMENYNF